MAWRMQGKLLTNSTKLDVQHLPSSSDLVGREWEGVHVSDAVFCSRLKAVLAEASSHLLEFAASFLESLPHRLARAPSQALTDGFDFAPGSFPLTGVYGQSDLSARVTQMGRCGDWNGGKERFRFWRVNGTDG